MGASSFLIMPGVGVSFYDEFIRHAGLQQGLNRVEFVVLSEEKNCFEICRAMKGQFYSPKFLCSTTLFQCNYQNKTERSERLLKQVLRYIVIMIYIKERLTMG